MTTVVAAGMDLAVVEFPRLACDPCGVPDWVAVLPRQSSVALLLAEDGLGYLWGVPFPECSQASPWEPPTLVVPVAWRLDRPQFCLVHRRQLQRREMCLRLRIGYLPQLARASLIHPRLYPLWFAAAAVFVAP